jgi:hypothetical protein
MPMGSSEYRRLGGLESARSIAQVSYCVDVAFTVAADRIADRTALPGPTPSFSCGSRTRMRASRFLR